MEQFTFHDFIDKEIFNIDSVTTKTEYFTTEYGFVKSDIHLIVLTKKLDDGNKYDGSVFELTLYKAPDDIIKMIENPSSKNIKYENLAPVEQYKHQITDQHHFHAFELTDILNGFGVTPDEEKEN